MPIAHELEALIERAQDGDVRAFEQLIVSQQQQVRRLARAFAASPADADDLAQEALLRVYKSLRLFRYQSAFSTWLYTVVRSVFLDFAKSRGGRQRAREEVLEPKHTRDLTDDAAADRLLEQEQERRRVWAALREVPVEFRTALVLYDIEGRSYDEIAAIEGVAVGTVKSRLSRGRGHLRRLLETADAEDAGSSGGSAIRAATAPPGELTVTADDGSVSSPAHDAPEQPGTGGAVSSSHLRRSGS